MSKNMMDLISILKENDTNRIASLDDESKIKLRSTINLLIESNTTLVPLSNLINCRSTIDSKLLQEKTMDLHASIKLALDSDGSILITKHEDCDFNTIFHNSHILLKEYEKVNNIESIKYELCKIYMIVSIINQKYIYAPGLLTSKLKIQDMVKLKSFIMNDFYKYLRIILAKENDFNFNEYYSQTQFGVETYKIDHKVIKGIKHILF